MSDQTAPVTVTEALVSTDVKKFSAKNVLTSAELQQAQQLAAKFDPNSSEVAIPTFGAPIMQELSDLSKPVLERVKTRDVAAASDVLKEFSKELDGVDLNLAYKQPANALEELAHKISDPIIRFLRSLDSLEKSVDRLEGKMRDASDNLLDRITTFGVLRDKYIEKVPTLYIYAAAAEIITDREMARLNDMKTQLAAKTDDPRLANAVEMEQTVVTRMRSRTINVLGQALKAYLMVPVIQEAEKSAEIVNDEVMNGIFSILPDLRATLVVLIGQYDTAKAAGDAAGLRKTGRKINDILSEQLGRTNDTVEAMVDDRNNDLDSFRKMRDSLVAQINRGIALDSKLQTQFENFAAATEEIQKSVAEASAQITAK